MQTWDRFACGNHSPVNYNDPSGRKLSVGCEVAAQHPRAMQRRMGFDPALGRFAQADSIIAQPDNPLDWGTTINHAVSQNNESRTGERTVNVMITPYAFP